mmetsp:Transcript_36770/g.91170  ORF Transcript_36770/g.91170 Transcript_36770/m.91170 type:complete len:243 (-) Transcript_36770:72-800(-)
MGSGVLPSSASAMPKQRSASAARGAPPRGSPLSRTRATRPAKDGSTRSPLLAEMARPWYRRAARSLLLSRALTSSARSCAGGASSGVSGGGRSQSGVGSKLEGSTKPLDASSHTPPSPPPPGPGATSGLSSSRSMGVPPSRAIASAATAAIAAASSTSTLEMPSADSPGMHSAPSSPALLARAGESQCSLPDPSPRGSAQREPGKAASAAAMSAVYQPRACDSPSTPAYTSSASAAAAASSG